MSAFNIQGFDHVAIAVRDLAASRDWYARVLGLERRHENDWGDVPSMMCAGDSCVALFPTDGARAPAPSAAGIQHFAWRVDRANFEAAHQRFRELDIDFDEADHGIAQSVYISDPDGHRIEITTYEL